jgi:hypothetical protein
MLGPGVLATGKRLVAPGVIAHEPPVWPAGGGDPDPAGHPGGTITPARDPGRHPPGRARPPQGEPPTTGSGWLPRVTIVIRMPGGTCHGPLARCAKPPGCGSPART